MENDRGNFQELRNMWSTKANTMDKPNQQTKSTNETIKKLPVLKIDPSTSPKLESMKTNENFLIKSLVQSFQNQLFSSLSINYLESKNVLLHHHY